MMTAAESIAAIDAGARELALFAAAGFLIGGIDDLVIDLIWLGRAAWRRIAVYSRFPHADAATLAPPSRPGRLVLFVAAWHEEAVIGAMVATTLAHIRHSDWRLYVGCYPNDPATIMAVRQAAADDPHVRLVICDAPGPTTKAGCLNWLWRALLADEAAAGAPVKAVILHDAEDIVHADELTVYDALIERFDLVQLPVEPVVVRDAGIGAALVSGHYCGEFAEAHGKQVVVREAVGAAVPSAGVGCAIARAALGRIADEAGGAPFDPASLTEDYELGLRIGAAGGRGAFVRLRAADGRGLVAVRACFPATIDAAVRQKGRWIAGIALAGWDRLGWSGGLAERWMRLRDRRALLAALVLAAAYAALAGWGIAWVAGLMTGRTASVAVPWPLLAVNLTLLGWRVAMRMLFTGRAHGGRMAALAPLHMLIGNIVAMMAAVRALALYLTILRHGWVRWDKTSHVFPRTEP
ncbi:MAG TPA: glycosyl transferase family protein [Sphingomonas sp.]